MAYIKSNDVSVFPSAFRKIISNGKYTNEQNFVNIINSIVDYPNSDGYIVKDPIDPANPLLIVIHGYLFEIKNWNDIRTQSKGNDVWFSIAVEDGDAETASNALVSSNNFDINLDSETGDNSQFYGLSYTTDEPKSTFSGGHIYSLKVFSNNNFVSDNFARLKTSSIWSTGKRLDNELSTINTSISTLNTTTTTLTNNKQDKLVSGAYTIIAKNKDNKLAIDLNSTTAKIIESLKKQEDATATESAITRIIGFDGNGIAKKSISNVGKLYSSTSTYIVSQNAYLNKGTVTAGYSVYASTSAPPSGTGKNGDVWFVYNG